jgi:hypothetical protein
MTTATDRLVRAIEHAEIPGSGVFAPDAVLDATVPNWRYTVTGAESIESELARWYADPGRFEDLSVTEIPGGVLLRFVLTWEEAGEPHMCHQAHVLTLRNDRIERDVAWCGGRWGAALQAEMADAALDG